MNKNSKGISLILTDGDSNKLYGYLEISCYESHHAKVDAGVAPLNEPVWFKLLSSRTSFQLEEEFQAPPNLNSEVSTPKILLFSSWYFMQIGWWESVGHLQTLSWSCPTFQIKVQRCPQTRTRAGNSSSYWAVQNPHEAEIPWEKNHW